MKRFSYGITPLDFVWIAAAVAIIIWLCTSLGSMKAGSTEEGRRIAEDAVKRAAMTCYAIEGCYPPDYDYIAENYDVAVDKDRYTVHYDIFASNIIPEIAVLRTGGGE